MVTIRPVERAPRTISNEPIVNDYTDLVLELQKIEQAREKGKPRQEAVIEQDELPEGTTAREVRLEINRTARTHNIGLNFKTGKDDWPIIFGVSRTRETGDEDDAADETPKATGKAA